MALRDSRTSYRASSGASTSCTLAGLLVDPRRHDGFRRRNPEPDGRRKRDDPCIHTTQDTRHSNEADCRCDATCSWPHGDVRVLQRADSPR